MFRTLAQVSLHMVSSSGTSICVMPDSRDREYHSWYLRQSQRVFMATEKDENRCGSSTPCLSWNLLRQHQYTALLPLNDRCIATVPTPSINCPVERSTIASEHHLGFRV